MSKNNKVQVWLKNIAVAGIGLCGLCCLLPLIGLVLGVSGLGAVAFYLEKISVAILVIGLMVLLFWQILKHLKKPCGAGCACEKHNACNVPNT